MVDDENMFHSRLFITITILALWFVYRYEKRNDILSIEIIICEWPSIKILPYWWQSCHQYLSSEYAIVECHCINVWDYTTCMQSNQNIRIKLILLFQHCHSLPSSVSSRRIIITISRWEEYYSLINFVQCSITHLGSILLLLYTFFNVFGHGIYRRIE